MNGELKRLRKLAGFSQRELAKRAGFGNHAIISLAEARGLRLTAKQEKKIRAVLLAALKERAESCSKALQKPEPICATT